MNGLWKIALLALLAAGSLEDDASAQNGDLWNELREAQVSLDDGGRLVYTYDPDQRSDGDARAIALRARAYYCGFHNGWTCPAGASFRSFTTRGQTSSCVTQLWGNKVRIGRSSESVDALMVFDCSTATLCVVDIEFGPFPVVRFDGPPNLPPLTGPGTCASRV